MGADFAARPAPSLGARVPGGAGWEGEECGLNIIFDATICLEKRFPIVIM